MSNQNLTYQNIFCLEGEWNSTNLKEKTTVKPLINFMEETFGIEYVFRKVNSKESFLKYLENLNYYRKGKFKSYGILYLAFHGESNCIYLDNEDHITLDEIIEETDGLLTDRIIHFGSCKTLKLDESDLKKFLKKSGAKAVSGFSQYIDFLDSSLFDIAYLTCLTGYDKTGYIYNHMIKNYGELTNKLGFVYIDKNS